MKFGEKLLSVSELAAEIGRCPTYIYKLKKMGAPVFGGSGYVSEIIEFIRQTDARPFSKTSKNFKKLEKTRKNSNAGK